MLNTYRKIKSRKLAKEIKSLPVEEYDLIINDFEPVSAWAAYLKHKPCVALSNQCAIFSKNSPRPKHRDLLGEMILKYYAPSTSEFGFHFSRYDKNIFTPIIRKEIREIQTSNKGHYTVYLPAYDDRRLIKLLSKIENVKWEVFSKHNKESFRINDIHIQPITNEAFIKSVGSCEGLLTGAGFGATSEALYLKKKLLVIPMKAQYEQHCNAAALNELGVPSIKSLKKKHLHHIEEWIKTGKVIEVDYPDITEEIVDSIIENHFKTTDKPLQYAWNNRKIREELRISIQ